MALTNGEGVTLFHLSCLLCGRKSSSCASRSVWGGLSHCRSSGILAVSIYLLFTWVKTGPSDSFLDQVNKYLTCHGLYFNVTLHRHQHSHRLLLVLHEAASVSWAPDRMICLSHLIIFLLTLSGQCVVEAAVNMEKWVLLECSASTVLKSFNTTWDLQPLPLPLQKTLCPSTYSAGPLWHRRIVDRPEGGKVRSLTSEVHYKQEKSWDGKR